MKTNEKHKDNMSRVIRFNAWIPELEYMMEDVTVGHGTIGFGSDDEDFEVALKSKGFDKENLPSWIYDTGEDWFIITDPEHFVLLQYIGLPDKNGGEIYEHDICTKMISPDENNRAPKELYRGEIVYHFGGFCLLVDNYYYPMSRQYGIVARVGNIFQHPELLSTHIPHTDQKRKKA